MNTKDASDRNNNSLQVNYTATKPLHNGISNGGRYLNASTDQEFNYEDTRRLNPYQPSPVQVSKATEEHIKPKQ